jgi:hypothetical protein
MVAALYLLAQRSAISFFHRQLPKERFGIGKFEPRTTNGHALSRPPVIGDLSALFPIVDPSPIAVRYSSAVLRSTAAPRRIVCPHHCVDLCLIVARRLNVVFHHCPSLFLHRFCRIWLVAEKAVNNPDFDGQPKNADSPPLAYADITRQRSIIRFPGIQRTSPSRNKPLRRSLY